MKKQQGVVPFLISLFIIGGLYEPVLRFLRYLMHRPFLGLESFTRLPKDQLLMLAVFLFGCILFISSIVKMLRAAPSGKAPARPAPQKNAPRPAAQTRPQVRAKARAHRDTEAEEAIHCAHLTGRAKYLEQIDNYLKTGLIDKDEYRVLKNRYMNLDIPDEYH
jgi:hypothetical protein